jgi:predicted DNA-binding transcriptional regulator AlpA
MFAGTQPYCQAERDQLRWRERKQIEGDAVVSRKIHPAKAAQAATYSIPEVATLLGIGRNGAYEAALRGDFPVLRIGGRIVAPRSPIDRMLCRGDDAADQGVSPRCTPASETADEDHPDGGAVLPAGPAAADCTLFPKRRTPKPQK